MSITFKLTQRLFKLIREDLQRSHPFAEERVGFITCRFAVPSSGDLLVLAHEYYPVADKDYVDDSRYGALLGSNAFRNAMQLAYTHNVGIFHIHPHMHYGLPKPSPIDKRETAAFVPDFFHVRPQLPHGALIISINSLSGQLWHPISQRPQPITLFKLVGAPLVTLRGTHDARTI